MASKTKKVSVGAIENAYKDSFQNEVIVEWNDIAITVKRTISIRDMLEFVDMVVKSCFKEDTGEYMPEVRDFAVRDCIIAKYTNVSLPSNVEKRYEILYGSDLVDIVVDSVNDDQFKSILRAVDEKMHHIAQANVNTVMSRVYDLFDALNGVQERLEASFSGIDANALNKFMSTIGNGDIDENKMVNAIISASRENGEN